MFNVNLVCEREINVSSFLRSKKFRNLIFIEVYLHFTISSVRSFKEGFLSVSKVILSINVSSPLKH